MPTIEIVSINSTGLGLNQVDYNIAIIEDNKMVSHRGLFYELLKKQKGTIVHLGSSKFNSNKEGFFFAGQLIDWNFEATDIYIPEVDYDDLISNLGTNQQFRFKFLDIYKTEIDKILKLALEKSPIKKVCFLTDYQFGEYSGLK